MVIFFAQFLRVKILDRYCAVPMTASCKSLEIAISSDLSRSYGDVTVCMLPLLSIFLDVFQCPDK